MTREEHLNELENLMDRLSNATQLLAGLAEREHNFEEVTRLLGKAEGVLLAFSYVEEMLR